MKITRVIINNILSIERADVSFGDTGLVLVDGWNYDDDTANAAGKTAIFNALAFGIYGKMPRDVTTTDYLRKGSKTGFTEVHIECGNDLWVVKHCRPNNVSYIKNNQSELITQDEFEKSIGLTYIQFLLTVYAAQSKTEKFLLLNDIGKKDFLLQLMNLDKFSISKEFVNKQLKSNLNQVATIDQQLSAIVSKIQVLTDSYIDIETVNEEISKCDTTGIDKEIDQLSNINEPDIDQFRQIEQGLLQKRKGFDQLRIDIGVLRNEYNVLTKQRKNILTVSSVSCPHCEQEVVVTTKGIIKSSDIEARNTSVLEDNQKIEDQKTAVVQQIKELEVQLEGINDLDLLESRVKDKQYQKMAEFRQVSNRLSELRNKRSQLIQKVEFLNQRVKDNTLILQKVQQAEVQQQTLLSQKDTLRIERTILETLANAFSPLGVQAYIADMVLDLLNERVSDYMSQMWPNASYRLVSYKETKAGEIKAKFSEKIVIGGKEHSLGSLSGGEFRCISLAVDLAVVDVVTQMFGICLNPLILDEPFDGMDSSNRERAIEVLSRLAQTKTILVIDHSSEVRAMFSSVIRAEKRNRVTTIV